VQNKVMSDKAVPPDQNVQNEANFLRTVTKDKSFAGNELW